MKRENLEWLRGPVSHLHIRYPGEKDGTLSSSEPRQFTHTTALQYLELLSGDTEIKITDTNHAMLALDVDRLQRPENEGSKSWRDARVKEASDATSQRITKIREADNDKVVIGIEVDILDEKGSLSLDKMTLDQLDYVIVSFHRFIWSIVSDESYLTPEYLINLYMSVVDNEAVSVLGHSTRVSTKLLTAITSEDYLPLIERMSERGVAFEINVLNDLSSDEEKLTRGVIRLCVKYGTPIVLSLDFHHLHEVAILQGLSIDDEVTEANIDQIFRKNDQVHFRMLRRLISNVDILKQMGVTKDMVVNSSNQGFDSWLKKRKELTSRFRMTSSQISRNF